MVLDLEHNLSLLINLQQLDLEKKRFLHLIEKAPSELKVYEDRCNSIKEKIKLLEEDIEKAKKERKKKEIEASKERDRLANIKNKLLEVKNNDEYKAINNEIEFIKNRIKAIEDEELEVMEKIEDNQRAIEPEKRLIEKEDSLLGLKKREMEQLIKETKDAIDKIDKERENIIRELNSSIFENYKKVAMLRDGLAVVAYSNNVCQGCYMGITPQMVTEIKGKACIHQCPHCNRFLYWREETGL